MTKKKKKAPKRKQAAAAAARENTNNETTPTASYEENCPAFQTENGATAVFAEPNAVSPKRVVLPENMLAPNVHDIYDKGTEDCKQYPLPTEICSSVTASQPQGTSSADQLMLLRLMYLNWIHKKMMASVFTIPIEVNAAEVTAAKRQEAAISEEVNDIENNILEAFEHGKKFVAVPDNEEAVTATKPAADILYRTHDAVSTEVVTPEVLKQLQTIKEIIKDILNRLNAIDAQFKDKR